MVTQEQRSNRRQLDDYLKIGLSLAMAIIGYFLTRESIGEISLRWMYVYHISEFDSWGKVGDFYLDLRTGVSPVWALLDIVSYRLLDNVHLTETWLYRCSLILAYILPLWLFGRARWQLVASFVAGIIFLWATVVIHPGNPQVYDAYMPALVLLLLKLLEWLRAKDMQPRLR